MECQTLAWRKQKVAYHKLSGYSPIGLFLGLDTVYAVQLKMRGNNKPLLTAAARAALPPAADLVGPGRELLRDTIKALLASADFKGKRVHVNLPHSGAVRRYVQVHKGRSSLAEVARMDLETVFPETPLEKILFAPVNVGERKISGAKIDEYVLLAAVPEFLSALSTVTGALRLRITGIGFAPEAAWWATRRVAEAESSSPEAQQDEDDEEKASLTAVLSPVGNAIDLSLWDGDRLAFVKLIGRETGAPQALERMGEDVGEALWFYLSVHRESQLKQVVSTGILAEYDQFKLLLEKNLDVPVRSMLPSELVEQAAGVELSGPGAWTEAMGLCVLGALAGQGHTSELDFTPRALAQARSQSLNLFVGVLLVLLLGGAPLLYSLWLSRQIDTKSTQIEQTIEGCQDYIRRCESHNNFIASLQNDQIDPALERMSWVRLAPITGPVAVMARQRLHAIQGLDIDGIRVVRLDPDKAGDAFSVELVVTYHVKTPNGSPDVQRLFDGLARNLKGLQGFDLSKDLELTPLSAGNTNRFRAVMHWRIDPWL